MWASDCYCARPSLEAAWNGAPKTVIARYKTGPCADLVDPRVALLEIVGLKGGTRPLMLNNARSPIEHKYREGTVKSPLRSVLKEPEIVSAEALRPSKIPVGLSGVFNPDTGRGIERDLSRLIGSLTALREFLRRRGPS
jgi:hypothetical protein